MYCVKCKRHTGTNNIERVTSKIIETCFEVRAKNAARQKHNLLKRTSVKASLTN